MSKNETYTVGYPSYTCRLCGGSYTAGLRDLAAFCDDVLTWSQTEAGLAWQAKAMSCITKQQIEPKTRRAELYGIHCCPDGQRGVADLKGMVGLRQAITRWRKDVDPTTRKEIPYWREQ